MKNIFLSCILTAFVIGNTFSQTDCRADTSFTDILFLVDNSGSIDDQEYASFEQIMRRTLIKVRDKCPQSQYGVVHYGGARGVLTEIEYNLSVNHAINGIQRQFCTQRDPITGNCVGGGGDDLNNAVGKIIEYFQTGELNRNPKNKLVLVIFTDAFGFEESCGFVNCSLIRPFTNIDRLKRDFGAQVTVVGASQQAEASLLAIYASPGGSFSSVPLFAQDCPTTFDGCELPRKYIPIEFDSPVEPSSDSIVACVSCEIEIIEGVIASAGQNVSICSDRDESATLTATLQNGTAPISYVWDQGLGTGAVKTVKPSVTTTYTVEIIDANDCSATASVTVTVEDCTPPCVDPPVLTVPDTYVTCPDNLYLPEQAGFATARAGSGSLVCPNPKVSFEDRMISIIGCSIHVIRTWTAQYPGLTNPAFTVRGDQDIYLIDTTPPIITNLPADITVNSDASCSAIVSWPTITGTDNCKDVTITTSRENGSRFGVGVFVVNVRAVDACGNSTMDSFTVTVIDNCCSQAPIIICPDNYNGCPEDSIDPTNTGVAIGRPGGDNCPTPTISYRDEIVSETTCEKLINRHWTASYVVGEDTLRTSCFHQIRLVDTERPNFISFPDDIVIASSNTCMATVTWPTITAQDNCGTVTITTSKENGSSFDIGTTFIDVTATDACGNSVTGRFSVTVTENCCQASPFITCPADYVGCPGESLDPVNTGLASADAASMNCEKPELSFSDEIVTDTTCYQEILRTWTARTQVRGEVVEINCVQRITLQDTEAPIFTRFPEDIVIPSDQNCGIEVNWLNPLAEDNCGNPTITSSIENGSRLEIGTHEVTFSAVDACGNMTTRVLRVLVELNCCREAPILVCPSDHRDCPNTSSDPTRTGQATARPGGPNCPEPAVTFTDEVMNPDPCKRVIKRTWRADYPGLNDLGLFTTCEQIIALLDTTPPTIIQCLPDLVLDPHNPVLDYDDAEVTDVCSFSLSYSIARGKVLSEGVHVVVVTATDGCGNLSTCSFTVTVPPRVRINCPDDVELSCIDSLDLSSLPIPSVETQCAACADPIEGYTFLAQNKGRSFYISHRALNWKRAKSEAEAIGAQLVVISDAHENAMIAAAMSENSAFIGLSDHEKEGTFVWVDGSPLTYSNWFVGQPNNHGNFQDFVEIMRNGFWNDQSNNKSLKYIIEVSCVNITRTLVSQHKEGSADVYTVMYKAEDRCGTRDSCEIMVTVANDSEITCPSDIEVYSLHGWTRVEWQEPSFSSCCNVCVARQIPGYLYMGQLGDSHYYCSYSRETWLNARIRARQIGGELVTIDTEEENKFLAQGLIDRKAYIGLSDYEREGVFSWADGSSSTYRNWANGAPNNMPENDFTEMGLDGKWSLSDKSTMREFIVEIKGCQNVTQTAGLKSGSLFREGVTTISYKASDGCGNEEVCSFTITVIKGSPPQAAKESTDKNNKAMSTDDRITLYPNPVSGVLFVENNAWVETVMEIRLINTTGQMIRRIYPQELFNGHNISDLSSGLHFLQFIEVDGKMKIEKFIVN